MTDPKAQAEELVSASMFWCDSAEVAAERMQNLRNRIASALAAAEERGFRRGIEHPKAQEPKRWTLGYDGGNRLHICEMIGPHPHGGSAECFEVIPAAEAEAEYKRLNYLIDEAQGVHEEHLRRCYCIERDEAKAQLAEARANSLGWRVRAEELTAKLAEAERLRDFHETTAKTLAGELDRRVKTIARVEALVKGLRGSFSGAIYRQLIEALSGKSEALKEKP